jgi:hypothetical protein
MNGKIGIGIIVLTFVLSAINPYVLMFTIPVFIIGALLIWFSKRQILSKILWTVLPVLLWYPTFVTFMYLSGTIGTATAQKFDFIFPNGFKGSVILVGNISCGQQVKIKDGREQLLIPNNGILLYQGEVETGYVNHKYYYQLPNDSLIPLPDRANYMYFDSKKNQPSTDVVGVWLGSTGTKTSYEPKPKIEYSSMTLTVDSKDSIDLHYDFQTEKRFENLTDSLIRECAKKKLISKQKK